MGLGLRPGFPLILGVVSSGFVPASLPSLLHLRTLLLEQLATSRAGDGSAPGRKHRANRLEGKYVGEKKHGLSLSCYVSTLTSSQELFLKALCVSLCVHSAVFTPLQSTNMLESTIKSVKVP